MQADGVFQRHRHLFEEHLVAAAGAHAQMVPALHDTDAWAVAAHQPGTHAWDRIVAARPYRQPGQPRNAGGVELVPGQPPAVADTPRQRTRQTAA